MMEIFVPLACRSRRPEHHPHQHSQDEIALIRRYQERNKDLGLYELWFKLRKQGYRRHYVSLYRVMQRKDWSGKRRAQRKRYQAQAYEQMQYPGQRIQVDVKVVPKACIVDKKWKQYYQYTAIDEYSRLRYLEGFQTADTFSSAIFIEHAIALVQGQRNCLNVQTDNDLSSPNAFYDQKRA